jgi:glutamine amidotransferase
MIGIIDYGMGNLRSVWNALETQAIAAKLVATPAEARDCDRLIIPGVGAFAQAMQELHARGLVEPIRAHAASGKPVLGICLGMQVLMSTGTEPTETAGLDLISGVTDQLRVSTPHRLPHVGWNSIGLSARHPLFEGVRASADYYFVHSYVARPADTRATMAVTEYGEVFTSVVAQGSVVGVQFHPEKSQSSGMRVLENFSVWDGSC